MAELDLVGLNEIADRLGVQRSTADMWRYRDLLPEPRWVISGTPIWDWQLDILPWARTTGRVDDDPR